MIIPLTKDLASYIFLFMGVSYLTLLDLEAAFASRIVRRKSLLIEATNFRVGTFRNSLLLASFSIGDSL